MRKLLEYRGKLYLCPLDVSNKMLSGKWKECVICHLINGPLRSAELFRQMGCVSQKVLTQQLREMEKDRLVRRTIVYNQPVEVTYTLMDKAVAAYTVIQYIREWCDEWLDVDDPDFCACYENRG